MIEDVTKFTDEELKSNRFLREKWYKSPKISKERKLQMMIICKEFDLNNN